MDAVRAIERVKDALRADRVVYGEPVTAAGVTVLPAARVGGAGGGGTGRDEQADSEGGGEGLGFGGRPSGAFVLSQGDARWVPAVDVNRLVMAVAAVAIVALLTARGIVRARAEATRPNE